MVAFALPGVLHMADPNEKSRKERRWHHVLQQVPCRRRALDRNVLKRSQMDSGQFHTHNRKRVEQSRTDMPARGPGDFLGGRRECGYGDKNLVFQGSLDGVLKRVDSQRHPLN